MSSTEIDSYVYTKQRKNEKPIKNIQTTFSKRLAVTDFDPIPACLAILWPKTCLWGPKGLEPQEVIFWVDFDKMIFDRWMIIKTSHDFHTTVVIIYHGTHVDNIWTLKSVDVLGDHYVDTLLLSTFVLIRNRVEICFLLPLFWNYCVLKKYRAFLRYLPKTTDKKFIFFNRFSHRVRVYKWIELKQRYWCTFRCE